MLTPLYRMNSNYLPHSIPILFGGFEHFFLFHNLWDVILPIHELIFFKMVKSCSNHQPAIYSYIFPYNPIYIYRVPDIYIYSYIFPAIYSYIFPYSPHLFPNSSGQLLGGAAFAPPQHWPSRPVVGKRLGAQVEVSNSWWLNEQTNKPTNKQTN